MLIKFNRQGSFIATDAARNLYKIVIVQETVHNDKGATEPRRYLVTGNGKAVNRKQKGRYELADSGLALRSNDPACL